MSVRRVQEEVDSREFQEWRVFDMLEPGEPIRGDYHAAQIVAMLENVNGAKPQVQPQDRLLKFKAPDLRQQVERDMEEEMMTWARIHNASLEKKAKRRKKRVS